MVFNTKTMQFVWKEFFLMIDGIPCGQITDFSHKTSKVIEEGYAAGDEPQYLGEGNKAYSGSVEMLQSTYEALNDEAIKRYGKDADITDLEVTLQANWIPKNPKAISKTVHRRISGVKFPESEYKIGQGSTGAKITLPFKALSIRNI